jgi:hypothetical protein
MLSQDASAGLPDSKSEPQRPQGPQRRIWGGGQECISSIESFMEDLQLQFFAVLAVFVTLLLCRPGRGPLAR